MKKTIFILTLLTIAAYAGAQTVINLTLPAQDPALKVSAGDDQTITEGETAQLQATVTGGSPGYSFLWYPGDSVVNNSLQNTETSPADTTTFIVTVRDLKKCRTTDTVTINVKEHISALKIKPENILQVYPNPVNEYFHIDLKAESGSVTVTFLSVQGKAIWQKNLKGGQIAATRFEPDVESGTYLLKVETENQIYTQPIVVSQNK
jgi:hypothetical protein